MLLLLTTLPSPFRHTVVAVLALVSLFVAPAKAQGSRPTILGAFRAGDSVRFQSRDVRGLWRAVRVVDGDHDMLVGAANAEGEGERSVIARDDIALVEQYDGERDRALQAELAAIGPMLTGTGATLAIATAINLSPSARRKVSPGQVLTLGLGATTVASVAAYVKSYRAPTARWIRVPLGALGGETNARPVVKRSRLTGWNLGVRFNVR